MRSYAIVSPNSGDGKTMVTANMAVALGRAQLRVVVVEGNLQNPRLHEMFDVERRAGLREILRGDIDLETASIDDLANRTTLSHVAVVPAGVVDDAPTGWAKSARFGQLMKRLSYAFDLVLVDASSSEAVPIAKCCDGVILLVRSGGNGHQDAVQLRETLLDEGTYVTGTVINRIG